MLGSGAPKAPCPEKMVSVVLGSIAFKGNVPPDCIDESVLKGIKVKKFLNFTE